MFAVSCTRINTFLCHTFSNFELNSFVLTVKSRGRRNFKVLRIVEIRNEWNVLWILQNLLWSQFLNKNDQPYYQFNDFIFNWNYLSCSTAVSWKSPCWIHIHNPMLYSPSYVHSFVLRKRMRTKKKRRGKQNFRINYLKTTHSSTIFFSVITLRCV